MSTKYFSGDIQLMSAYPMRRHLVRAKFPTGTIRKYDDFSLLVGSESGLIGADWLPVTRAVQYKENGSKHKCDARCLNAKGHTCECECGGKNHGKNK
jgi:hypothetical protein